MDSINWLDKTPTELFKTIPQDILDGFVTTKQQKKTVLNQQADILKMNIINQLLTRHILSQHQLPNYIIDQENLIRWLFCIYIIE